MGVTCWGGDRGAPRAAEPHMPPACFPCVNSSTLHDQVTAFREGEGEAQRSRLPGLSRPGADARAVSGTGGAARKPGPLVLRAAARDGAEADRGLGQRGPAADAPQPPAGTVPKRPGGICRQSARGSLPPHTKPHAAAAARTRKDPARMRRRLPEPLRPARGAKRRAATQNAARCRGSRPGHAGTGSPRRREPAPHLAGVGRPKGPMGAAARRLRPAPPDVGAGTWPPPVPGH